VDPGSNLDTLMARYQAGDFPAATALIQRIGPQLHRFFWRNFPAVQMRMTCCRKPGCAYTGCGTPIARAKPVLPWFYAIARRVRIDHFRRASRTTARERSLEEALDVAVTFPREEGELDDLEALLAPLSESQREVIRMMKVAGMSLRRSRARLLQASGR